MFKKYISLYLTILLAINPMVLLLLTRSFFISFLFPLSLLILSTFIASYSNVRIKVWAFNICLIIGICLHSELFFRSFLSEYDIPNLYQPEGNFYFNRPCLEQEFIFDEYSSIYRTNCQGYRIDELIKINDSITCCDWLFIGDSFTQGAQVNYKDLFSTILYQHYPNKLIVNAGISGAGIYEEMNYYKKYGCKLNPQKVILQLGVFNDFMNVYERKATFKEYLTAYSSLYRFLEYNLSDNEEDLPLGRWVEPFRESYQSNVDFNIFFKPSSRIKEEDKKNMLDCIKKFKDLVESNGGELIILLLPTKEQTSNKMLDEVLESYGIDKTLLDMTYPNRWMKNISDSLEIDIIDLYEKFRASSEFPFFYQDEHMNKYGHELVSGALVDYFNTKERPQYEMPVLSNTYDRYPTIYRNYMLFQSVAARGNLICSSNTLMFDKKVVISSNEDLIHPIMNEDCSLMAFTKGCQDENKTNVILHSFSSGKSTVITKDRNQFSSIPTFSHDGDKIVYATWQEMDYGSFSSSDIAIYSIKEEQSEILISDGFEKWRPIFSKNDSSIYYIKTNPNNGKFGIFTYDLYSKTEDNVLVEDYDIWDISLSPSGKYMLYAGRKNDNWDIFIYDLISCRTQQLTDTLGDEWDPTFGEDDSDIWFAGEMGCNNGIYHKSIKL